MKRIMPAVVGMLVLAAAAVSTSAQQPEGPRVTVYRTFVDPEYTAVEGLIGIEPAQLDTTCEYGVNVVVRDAQGTELVNQGWENACPQVAGSFAPALETFQFGLKPGDYTVEVAAFPKGNPAMRGVTVVTVHAYAASPVASDLVLAHDVGMVDSATAGQWTMRRGNVGVRVASTILIDPADPSLAYYLELYPQTGDTLSGSATGVVRRSDGKELASIPLQQIAGVSEPQPMAGKLSVAGLPAGAYTFDVQLQLEDTTVLRSRRFEVLAQSASSPGAAAASQYFTSLSDAELADLFDPVVVWLANDADADRYRSLSPQGKRVYLTREFGRAGPTPDDGDESALDAFLQRVQTVKERYTERAQPGWQTDRGRIYLLRGEPAAKTMRPKPMRGAPYELWHFTGQYQYVYLFADETGLGNYRLIYTTDPQQHGLSDWDKKVGLEALDDMRQMGIQVPYVDRSGGSRP